jgi:hypothetical protein
VTRLAPSSESVRYGSRITGSPCGARTRCALDRLPTVVCMEHHDCKPPGGRQPIDRDRWTCPECGDLWEATSLVVESYDFANDEAFKKKEWTRVRSGEASPQVLVQTFGESEGTELCGSFCRKSRTSVRHLFVARR